MNLIPPSVMTLSDKDRSMLGIGVFPGFRDFFNNIANDGEPDATNWTVIEAVGSVRVIHNTAEEPGYLYCLPDAAGGNDAIAHTIDKRVFALKELVLTIRLEARVKFDWASDTGEVCGIGFMENECGINDIVDLTDVGNRVASIVVVDNVPTAYTTDGAAETTDLSAFITDNTWFDLRIIISREQVEFYIDGILRATHDTNVPIAVWCFVCGATSEGDAITEKFFLESIDIWGE
ncbi:hypothetical protein ES702_04954 [subsurface metagenome]